MSEAATAGPSSGGSGPSSGEAGALGKAVTARLGLLGAALRAGGVRVGVGELLSAHRALAAVDAGSRREAFLALRPVLCSRRSDLDVFETAFLAVFGAPSAAGPPPAMADAAMLVLPRVSPPAVGALPSAAELDEDPWPTPAPWSAEELIRQKDFRELTVRERELAARVIARLARRAPRRRARRLRPVRRDHHTHGARPDLRRTIRASLRYGGEPVERRWRRPTERERRVVLVCDVSGSMEPYARMLLQYLQACVAHRRRVEAFVFGTRLTRVTRELEERDADRALAHAVAHVSDWSGGTRIGECLAELNRAHGRRIGRGAVVVVLSDGWDRGDPRVVSDEMGRLGRCAHAVIWLNPLKAAPGYEPLTRGMAAALPHVDHFLAGNSLGSLERLARLLENDPAPARRGGTL